MESTAGMIGLPRDVDVTALAEDLAGPGTAVVAPPAGARRVWLDTFDWRLWSAGLVLEWCEAAGGGALRLAPRRDADGGALEIPARSMPADVAALPPGVLRRRLAPVLDVRALLARCDLRGQMQSIRVLDRREKTVARLELWRPRRRGPVAARVVALRGYEKAAARLRRRLESWPGAAGALEDPLLAHAAQWPVPPGGYPAWTLSGLDPRMRTDDALKRLLAHYARIMDLNVPGMRAALDSEFLHDFRVGLRRSRTLLRRVPGVFAAGRVGPFRDHLAWLSAETGPPRDADVHRLVFPEYARGLGAADARALAPLMIRVQREQATAHARLRRVLDTSRFGRRWAAWRRFLEKPPPRGSRQPAAREPLAVTGSQAARRAARKVRRQGRRLRRDSPPAAYHEVRKSCKTLRYLIDAFEEAIQFDGLGKAIRRLKSLQELLGEHQDLDVHRGAIQVLHQQMAADGELGGETHVAMEALVRYLNERSARARAGFPEQFARFLDVGLERALAARGT